MKEDKKGEEKLKAERIEKARKMADKMFQVAKKGMKVGVNEQLVSLACTCTECIHERRWWMFENNYEHQNLWLAAKWRKWKTNSNR